MANSGFGFPRWRTVNLMPGNVEVACNVCDQRVYGVTAADTLAAIKQHLSEHDWSVGTRRGAGQ